MKRTMEKRSRSESATRCGVAGKNPFVQRSTTSAMITVNFAESPPSQGNTPASRHVPAASRSSRPGADWCSRVKHSKSVCSAMPTARTPGPVSVRSEARRRFLRARAVPASRTEEEP